MRKLLPVILITIVIVAAGGLAASWYVQAKASKQAVIDMIARLNADKQWLTYEKIETSGFPLNVNVDIVRPKIALQVDELLKPQANALSGAADGSDEANMRDTLLSLPSWREETALDGRITLGVNIFADKYTLRISGPWASQSTIGDKQVNMAVKSTNDSTCELRMQREVSLLSGLWDANRLARSGDQFMADFRSLKCALGSYEAVDAVSNEKIVVSAANSIEISHTPQASTRDIVFKLSVPELEATPRADEIIALYAPFLLPKGEALPPTMKLSAYGKQLVEINFAWQGPLNPEALSQDAPFSMRLTKFELKNALYNSSFSLSVVKEMNGNNMNGRFALYSTNTMTKAYEDMLMEMARLAIDEIINSTDPATAQLRDALKKHPREDVYAAIAPAIPHVSSWGKTVLNIDGNYAGDSAMTNGYYKLNNFEASIEPYGLQAQGDGKVTPTTMPSGEVKLSCRACLAMVDGVSAWLLRVKDAIAFFDPEEASQIVVTQPLIDGYKRFLTELAGSNTGPDMYIYNFASDGGQNVTINGKPMMEVMQLFGQYVAPHLPQEGAPQ